jgi:uncharacterized protein (DUF2236 family)
VRPLQRAIAGEVHKLVSSRGSGGFERATRHDPGFFGPQSVAWKVHGDFTTMLVGGVSALLLQMLHPAALAGVWDHSNFRSDMAGRLRRTAYFLSGTTFGSKAQAAELITRVRSIHDRIRGTLPDGRPYAANDPELLAWVHVAGTWSFLHSYLRYGNHLSAAERDRYFAETSVIAIALGASAVPVSLGAAEAYLRDMKPQLQADSRTRVVATALLSQPAPKLSQEPLRRLVMSAGTGLLPDWAAAMHGFSHRAPNQAHILAVRGVRALLSWALDPGTRK